MVFLSLNSGKICTVNFGCHKSCRYLSS